MKLTKLFTKTRKDISKDEISINAQLLEKAGFISKEMAGVYNFLPLGLKTLRKIVDIIRYEMNKLDANEILMPTLASIEKYKKTKRDKLDILFQTKLHSGSEFILNQSHEEVVTPLLQNFIKSYKDLPQAVYQIQTKFRNEPRAKSGLLRGREFLMKDLYSFHIDEKDLDRFYEKVQRAYFNIFSKLDIKDVTYLVYASGGSFSKYSHEFQTVCETGEDKIYLCEKCKIGVNQEIIDEQKACPKCGNTELVIKKSIEVGNIFKLGTRFSDAFNFNYIDSDGKSKKIVMGCYGMGPTRIMGSIVELYHDELGISWPSSIAPYQIHLISLKQDKITDKVYNELTKKNIDVLYDDRSDISVGQKFVDADLLGMPKRIVISNKTIVNDEAEIKERKSGKIKNIKIKDILKTIS